MTSEAGGDRLDECTAVLMTVPSEVARRLETFLLANDVACNIRRNETMTPELVEEALVSAVPWTAFRFYAPLVGRMHRKQVARAMKVAIELSGAGLVPDHDVLVRLEDLPIELAAAGVAPTHPGDAEQPANPSAGPGQGTRAATPAPPAGDLAPGTAAVAALLWDAAWDLANRLRAAGMPATVLPAAGEPRGSGSIGEAMFHVVVQAGDWDRAKDLAAGLPLAGPPTIR